MIESCFAARGRVRALTEQAHKEKLSFALSEEWQAEFCRAAVGRISKAMAGLKPGDRMPDGTVYAGLSLSGVPMYTTPQDAGVPSLKEALRYAQTLDAHGHKDWRIPNRYDLDVLFQNRAAIGGFNETGSYPNGSYWSCWSSQPNINNSDLIQYFSDGHHAVNDASNCSSLRCVRFGEPVAPVRG
jgi:Protein of unknown function (DUF1566)